MNKNLAFRTAEKAFSTIFTEIGSTAATRRPLPSLAGPVGPGHRRRRRFHSASLGNTVGPAGCRP